MSKDRIIRISSPTTTPHSPSPLTTRWRLYEKGLAPSVLAFGRLTGDFRGRLLRLPRTFSRYHNSKFLPHHGRSGGDRDCTAEARARTIDKADDGNVDWLTASSLPASSTPRVKAATMTYPYPC
ncbi:hypothetical protein PG990_007095 [Apiospora arundinis]